MVREIKTKPVKGVKGLEQLEKETEKEVSAIEEERKKAFSDSDLDAGYYFSVVFNTNAERNAWLKKHNIKLEDDYIVRAKDFIE